MVACFAPKGLWYEKNSRSTPVSSVQTVRRQPVHFQFHSDDPVHFQFHSDDPHPHVLGHELDHLRCEPC